jgi:hypothetical protein
MNGARPRPWRLEPIGDGYAVQYRGEDGQWETIGRGDAWNRCALFGRDDAALIVRAVNAHDALVEALEQAADCIPEQGALYRGTAKDKRVLAKVTAALRLARGDDNG